MFQRALNRLAALVVGRLGDDLVDELGGGVFQSTGGIPLRVMDDYSSVRIGCFCRNASQLERE